MLNVLRLYFRQHAQMCKLGFALLDSRGQTVGHIDQISWRGRTLQAVGWTWAQRVGLSNGVNCHEAEPTIERPDLGVVSAVQAVSARGFELTVALGRQPSMLWVEVEGVRSYVALPVLSRGELNLMRLRQLWPLLRDATYAFPAALRWLIWRDPLAKAQIKAALRLSSAPVVLLLCENLLAEAGQSPERELSYAGDRSVSIILPIYNALDLLPEVLDRVLRHTDVPWHLILVEDCSSDPKVRPWLQSWLAELPASIVSRVELLENEVNCGFIGAVNRGFAAALPRGAPVILLNSDAFVPQNWASRLLRPIWMERDVASVTPMSNDAEIFNVPVMCQRDDMRPGEADALDEVAARFSASLAHADAPTGVGFCMAINIDMLRKLPEFDTVFGRGYGEEVDWCQRARALGGRHLGIANLFVEHRGGTSFGSEEKQRLIRANGATVSLRYPRYDQDVQDFIHADPLHTPRLALALAWAAGRQRGAVPIYLAHDMGGGAELYLRQRLRADLEADAAAVVVRVGGGAGWQLECHTRHGVTRGKTESVAFLHRLLDLVPKRHIVYSCGVGAQDPLDVPRFLTQLHTGRDARLEILFHDFYPISPSYTLLAGDGSWQGVPRAGLCPDLAHAHRQSDGTVVSLALWQEAWGGLLAAADELRCFSQSSRNIVIEAYPNLAAKVTVVPHKLLISVPRVAAPLAAQTAPVIGVLGNIGYPKGARVLQKLSQAMLASGRGRLVVVGNVDPAYPLTGAAVIHGDYDLGEIGALAARYNIGCWLIPSIWPETFSYTTHEALATGLPVYAFDLGAQAEAVHAARVGGALGAVLPQLGADFTAQDLLTKIFTDQVKTKEHVHECDQRTDLVVEGARG